MLVIAAKLTAPVTVVKATRVALHNAGFIKVFDPNQPRDTHGLWTDDPNSGKVHPFGPGRAEREAITGRDWAQKDLAHLSNTLGPNHPETVTAAASVNRFETEVQRLRAARKQTFEAKHPPRAGMRDPQGAAYGSRPSTPQTYSQWQANQQATQAALANQRQISAQAAGNLSLHDVPPDALRASIASTSSKAAAAMRNVAAVLSTLDSTNTSGEPSTLGRVAAAAAALTTAAVAANMASRATNAPTLLNAITAAVRAGRSLSAEFPHLVEAASKIDKPFVDRTVARASASLSRFEQSIRRTGIGAAAIRAATRTAFSATGGKVVPAGTYRPSVSTVTARNYSRGGSGPTKSSTFTMKPPSYPSR